MVTATAPLIGDCDHIVLHGVSWDLYQRIRWEVLDRKRMAYERGTLEIIAPSYQHEDIKTLLGRLVETFTLRMGIAMRPAGSTTFASVRRFEDWIRERFLDRV